MTAFEVAGRRAPRGGRASIKAHLGDVGAFPLNGMGSVSYNEPQTSMAIFASRQGVRVEAWASFVCGARVPLRDRT